MYVIYMFLFQLLLSSVLNGLYDAVSQILRKNTEKRALLENMDAVFLAIDEICDGGWAIVTFLFTSPWPLWTHIAISRSKQCSTTG